MATIRIRKSWERWSDEDVSARLAIYSEDGIQQLLLKAVSNCKMYPRCSVKLADMGIFHSAHSCRDKIKKLKQNYKQIKDHNNKSGNGRKTRKWYDRSDALLGHRPSFSGTCGETADSVACELSNDDYYEGEAGQLSGLETSELSPPDHNSSTFSSPFLPSKRKRKQARDDSVLDTIMAMDRRAMVSKENEDLRAKEMHDERLLHSHKAQESRWSNKIPFRLGFWQC